MLFFVQASLTSSQSIFLNNFCSCFCADLKVFALSDQMKEGTPRLLINLINALRNVAVDMSSTNSRWTALVCMQVNIAPQDFSILGCGQFLMVQTCLTPIGPKKSHAT